MNRSLEQGLSELYISNIDIIGEGLPGRVNAARRGFLESFTLSSLPSKRDERYRHCDLRELFAGEWEHYFTPSKEAVWTADRLAVEGYGIDLYNGFCDEDAPLVTLGDGIVYGSLRAAMREREDLVLKYYNTVADNDGEGVVALNSLFMQDGAFVYVPEGVSAPLPFVLSFEYGTRDAAQMCFARALVVVERGAHADVVVSHRSADGSRVLVDCVRETVVAGEGNVNMSEIVRMNDRSALVSGHYLHQEGDSRADMLSVWLRGGVTRVNARHDLAGRGCESNLYGLYFGTGDERTDINMVVNHLMPDCSSYESVKGVVSGAAEGAFTGRVYVAPDAQRTAAFQQNRNLQMSDTSKVYTEPQLEIYADDVKCSHGATVGQMDPEAIYYMRQRGIGEQEARRLQMFGFVNDIVSHCPHDGACDFVRELAEARINEL